MSAEIDVIKEFLGQLPEETIELAREAARIKELMQNTVKLRVPLLVSTKAGPNWYELEKIQV